MKKRILVVEKNIDILELINLVLTDEGYEVCCVADENNIFEQINAHKPDAILLDIVKPTTEGTELCRQLSLAEETAHLPVIVLSTHPQISKVKEICADEVVQKPFDIDFLLEVLVKQLSIA